MSDPQRQVLTGTTPFPDASGEEIADRVGAGIRPQRPSNNHSQEMEDGLWKLIVACWSQQPNERPATFNVLQTLLGLGEAQYQEHVAYVEGFDEEMMVRELERTKDGPDESAFLGWL